MLKVFCVRTGNKFDVDYVHKLRSMLGRHLSRPFEFVCLSDREIAGVQCVPTDLPRWWPKVRLFDEAQHPSLFFDLDTVIVDSVDPLADAVLGADDRRLYMLDPFRPTKSGWMSGVMAWVGDWSFLSRGFSGRLRGRFEGDQQYLTHKLYEADEVVYPVQGVLPGVCSYKRDNLAASNGALPDWVSVVCFHGRPMPHEVKHAWMEEHWR